MKSLSKLPRSGAFAAAIVIALLTGCASVHEGVYGPTPIPVKSPDGQAERDKFERLLADEKRDRASRIEMAATPYVDTRPSNIKRGEWLKQMRITVSEPSRAVPVSELLRALRAEGLNVTSQLPLNTYYYSGYGVTDMQADTALDVLLGTVGLDWTPNDTHKFVTISPMPSRTWTLNLGNRITDFTSSGSTTGGGSNSGGGSSGGGSSGSSGGGSAGGGSGGTLNGVSSSNAQTNSESRSSVKMDDNFWVEIVKEVDNRLKMLAPVQSAPAGPPGSTSAAAPSEELFREVKLGKVVANPTTGVLTVQAPRGIMDSIASYLDEVEASYNTRLVFEGRLFLITTTKDQSRGIDYSLFRKFADNYGVVVTNNALGGITFTPPVNGPARVTTGSTIAQSSIGVVSADNLLQAFFAYLESETQVTTVQRPLLNTTNGVPAFFSQTDKVYVNNVSENTATSQAGATTSRSNNLIPFEFGTILRLNPRYDAHNQRIRALISLVQVIQSGFTDIDQFVTGANGAATPVSTRIPLDRRVEYQGETLLTDGQIVVLGGQQFSTKQVGGNGVMGLRKSPLAPFFGRESNTDQVSTYYFALSVRTVPVEAR